MLVAVGKKILRTPRRLLLVPRASPSFPVQTVLTTHAGIWSSSPWATCVFDPSITSSSSSSMSRSISPGQSPPQRDQVVPPPTDLVPFQCSVRLQRSHRRWRGPALHGNTSNAHLFAQIRAKVLLGCSCIQDGRRVGHTSLSPVSAFGCMLKGRKAVCGIQQETRDKKTILQIFFPEPLIVRCPDLVLLFTIL